MRFGAYFSTYRRHPRRDRLDSSLQSKAYAVGRSNQVKLHQIRSAVGISLFQCLQNFFVFLDRFPKTLMR